MNRERDDHLDQEMIELERELERELADLPGSDREDMQRRPHLAYAVLYCEDPEDLALGDDEVEPVERDDVAEALA